MSKETAKTIACAIDSNSVYYNNVHLKEMTEDNFNELLKVHNTRARVVTGVTRQDHISPTIARMYCNRFGESNVQDWHAGLHVSNSHRSSHLNPCTRYLICWKFAIGGINSFADVSYRSWAFWMKQFWKSPPYWTLGNNISKLVYSPTRAHGKLATHGAYYIYFLTCKCIMLFMINTYWLFNSSIANWSDFVVFRSFRKHSIRKRFGLMSLSLNQQ